VEVLIDGKSLGNGAFAKVPVERGPHQVTLKEGKDKKTIQVNIRANEEEHLSPADWQ